MPLPLIAIGAALGAGQMILGGIQAISGSSKAKRLRAQRQAFKTPDEVTKILQATEQRASGGYDPATLEYLTSQTDRAFSGSVGALNRIGGDANDVAAAFDQKLQGIMKIGADNHAMNLENFGKYINALGMVASNKEAEYASRESMLKDDIQAAAANKQAGMQNLFGGASAVLGALSAGKQMGLYNQAAGAAGSPTGGTPISANTAATYLSGLLGNNSSISVPRTDVSTPTNMWLDESVLTGGRDLYNRWKNRPR